MEIKVNIPELSYSWSDHALQYPRKGRPGITHREEKLGLEVISEVLLYYDANGNLAGVLNYFSKDIPAPEPWMKPFMERLGNFNIIVSPKRRRLGIGMRLLQEASRRWPINFERQNYTIEGAKLFQKFLTQNSERPG